MLADVESHFLVFFSKDFLKWSSNSCVPEILAIEYQYESPTVMVGSKNSQSGKSHIRRTRNTIPRKKNPCSALMKRQILCKVRNRFGSNGFFPVFALTDYVAAQFSAKVHELPSQANQDIEHRGRRLLLSFHSKAGYTRQLVRSESLQSPPVFLSGSLMRIIMR